MLLILMSIFIWEMISLKYSPFFSTLCICSHTILLILVIDMYWLPSILQTTALKNGALRHDIHYWLGKDTTQASL